MFSLRKKDSGEKALDWFRANLVPDKGVIVHSRLTVPYAEVTGYFVPTLYLWGEPELARTCTKWLVSVQLPEGAMEREQARPAVFPGLGHQLLDSLADFDRRGGVR